MPEYRYITIKTSDNQQYKFKVVQAENIESFVKTGSAEETIDGGLDITMGKVRTTWNYIIRLRYEETEPGYGNYNDLKNLFKLTNPRATRSSKLTLIDHYGEQHDVRMVGEMTPYPLTTILTGDTAWYHVRITLMEV